MIAPVLLPLVQLLAFWVGNPAPIVEWEASPLPNGDGHRVTLEMVTLEPTDLCQLLVFVPTDANVAIQVSGTFGSRQEEAQRLGRILRPKKKGTKAHFYTIVTSETKEQEFALKRQLFLTEQGYRYSIETPNS